jgi:hypothetical protein
MIFFPPLTPTDMTLTLGEFGVRQNDWNGVWESPELTGSVESEPELALSFRNILCSEGRQLLTCHRRSGAGLLPVTATADLVAGVINPQMAAWILQPPGLIWVMPEPPAYSAVKANRVTVNVKLIAELRTPPPLPGEVVLLGDRATDMTDIIRITVGYSRYQQLNLVNGVCTPGFVGPGVTYPSFNKAGATGVSFVSDYDSCGPRSLTPVVSYVNGTSELIPGAATGFGVGVRFLGPHVVNMVAQ